jgi:PDZ domain-containing protein
MSTPTVHRHARSFAKVCAIVMALLGGLPAWLPSAVLAGRTVTVPISVTLSTDYQVGFQTFVMKWDEGGQPDPLALRWGRSQVPVRGAGMGSVQRAFQFAVERLAPSIHPTGVLSLYATVKGPLSAGGSSAEAAFAIGVIALLKGDPLLKEITITGTLESDGTIGQVSQIAEKTAAAARAGYRMLLVPRGQFYAPRINRVALSLESKVLVREVDTIEEAYEIMTGKKL